MLLRLFFHFSVTSYLTYIPQNLGNGPRFTYVEEFNYGSYEETNYESITAITNPN